MSLQLTTASVWNRIERSNFAVLGMVNARSPPGHFITYGIGVSLWAMRSPDQSLARVLVDAG